MAAKTEEIFIMAGDCATRVRYTTKGDCAIVLLHGYLESLDIWDEFAKLLAPHARVVAFDLPGHGISEVKGEIHTMAFLADVIYAGMRRLGIDKALIVGHSMGGYVALELLRRHPEVMTGIVLFHSSPNPDTEEKKNNRLREIELILGGKKELIARSFPQVGFAAQNRERFADEIEDLTEMITLTEDEGITAILRGLREREDNNETLRMSKLPQLAIFGRHDEYIPVEAAEKIVATQPQMRVVWLENSGHMGFIEEPEKSAAAIVDFLGSVCRDTGGHPAAE